MALWVLGSRQCKRERGLSARGADLYQSERITREPEPRLYASRPKPKMASPFLYKRIKL